MFGEIAMAVATTITTLAVPQHANTLKARRRPTASKVYPQMLLIVTGTMLRLSICAVGTAPTNAVPKIRIINGFGNNIMVATANTDITVK